jgi:hypothetical protein
VCQQVTAALQHMERAMAIMSDQWDVALRALSGNMNDLAQLLRDYGQSSLVQVR